MYGVIISHIPQKIDRRKIESRKLTFERMIFVIVTERIRKELFKPVSMMYAMYVCIRPVDQKLINLECIAH